jgi:hypothetical protein
MRTPAQRIDDPEVHAREQLHHGTGQPADVVE